MSGATARAPASLLLHSTLTASAKLIWLLSQLDPASGPTQLGAKTGLSQPTVRKWIAQLATMSWPPPGPRAPALPGPLLTDARISAHARLLYGSLQLLPCFQDQSGHFTYAGLSEFTGNDHKTVRSAAQALVRAGWLRITQPNQRARIEFTLSHPEHDRLEAERTRAMRRITEAPYTGEALMKEYLSLLIDSDQFEENANPGFLVNPFTQERLEFDRFYPPGVAFEFHGAQHDGPTERFPDQESASLQRGRDLIKLGICQERAVTLVIIRPRDLSLKGMQAKIGRLLPWRDLAHQGALIDYLERLSRRYRRKSTP